MHICGRSMVALLDNNIICGCGGIGRLIGFRFQRASVQVRVLSSAPNIREGASAPSFIFLLSRSRTRTHSSGTVRWTVPVTSSKTGGYNNFLPLGKKCKSSPVIRTSRNGTLNGCRFICFFQIILGTRNLYTHGGVISTNLQDIFHFQKGILQRICSCNMLYRSL